MSMSPCGGFTFTFATDKEANDSFSIVQNVLKKSRGVWSEYVEQKNNTILVDNETDLTDEYDEETDDMRYKNDVETELSDGILHLYYKYPDDGGWEDEEDDDDDWDDETIIDLFLDEKLIELIRANPSVTKGEMAKKTKAKSYNINDTLKELQEKSKIRHEGPLRGKGGKWFVVE